MLGMLSEEARYIPDSASRFRASGLGFRVRVQGLGVGLWRLVSGVSASGSKV